jgi:hypothetical protein
MSRAIILNLLASALTILATIAFLGATTMGTSAPVVVPADADERLVVYAFYDAINAVLRTGDPADLEAVVAPDFVLRGALTSPSADRAALARFLVATSAAAPGLRLELAEVSVADGRAIVHVAETPPTSATLLGVPFATPPPFWAPFNVLRIADGKVAELWSGDQPIPRVETLRQTRLDPLLTPDQAVQFRRLRADAEQEWSSESTFQSRVLYVEAGALTIDVDPSSPRPALIFAADENRGRGRTVPPGTRARVGEGEALALSPLALYELRDEGTQPDLRAYEIAFPRYASTESVFPGLAGTAAVGPPSPPPSRWEMLAAAPRANLPRAALRVTFGRITLPPGRPLALGEAPGPLLLVVESGTLGLDGRQDDLSPMTATVEPGTATLVPRDEASTLWAVGAEPVVLFAVTTLPVHAGTGVMLSSSPALPGP